MSSDVGTYIFMAWVFCYWVVYELIDFNEELKNDDKDKRN